MISQKLFIVLYDARVSKCLVVNATATGSKTTIRDCSQSGANLSER